MPRGARQLNARRIRAARVWCRASGQAGPVLGVLGPSWRWQVQLAQGSRISRAGASVQGSLSRRE